MINIAFIQTTAGMWQVSGNSLRIAPLTVEIHNVDDSEFTSRNCALYLSCIECTAKVGSVLLRIFGRPLFLTSYLTYYFPTPSIFYFV